MREGLFAGKVYHQNAVEFTAAGLGRGTHSVSLRESSCPSTAGVFVSLDKCIGCLLHSTTPRVPRCYARGLSGTGRLSGRTCPTGGRVLLVAFGSSAHIVMQLARHRQCMVDVLTRSSGHQAIARDLGAAWVGDDPEKLPQSMIPRWLTETGSLAKTHFGRIKARCAMHKVAWTLIDEVLTPDSSRSWPASQYTIGQEQPSFDKQYVRNYLQQLVDAGQWNKEAPGPTLPHDIVANTTARYLEAYEKLTGEPLD